jgi:hypothetical protein
MNWSDIPRNPSRRMLRQFGGLAAGLCLVMAAREWSWAWLSASLAVGMVTLTWPGSLRPIFVGWMVLAFPVGWVVGKLTLAAMFFGLFTVVGLLLRMMGRDPMGRRRRAGSYWTPRDRSTTPADYLRQY